MSQLSQTDIKIDQLNLQKIYKNCDLPGGRHDNDKADYRKIELIPTIQELECKSSAYLLQSNQMNYDQITDFQKLDHQFRLLREDMVQSLQEKINSQRSIIFQDVIPDSFDLCFKQSGQRPCIKYKFKNPQKILNLQFDDRISYWENSKISVDSIVLFQRDGQNLGLGTVAVFDQQWLMDKNGPYIGIDFENKNFFQNNLMELYSFKQKPCQLIFVCLEYFSFKHNLLALQQMKTIPLSPEILHDESKIKLDYLPKILKLPKDFQSLNINIYDQQSLQKMNKMLDPSQILSFQVALSSRVSLIQGPPGTGKTFIGTLLARTILENDNQAKILCVCTTNHALDQFLLDLLKKGVQSICRLGNRSQCEELNPFLLNNLINQSLLKKLNFQLKDDFKLKEQYKNQIQDMKSSLLEPEWDELLEYLFTEDEQIYKQLYFIPKDSDGFQNAGQNNKSSRNCDIWNEWKKGKNNTGYPQEQYRVKLQFGKYFWNLDISDRKKMIFEWTWTLKENDQNNFHIFLEKYNNVCNKINDAYDQVKSKFLKEHIRVIGATTTGMAMMKNLIDSVQPNVILVEEAGEILESHILTTLSKHTEHLIMIGDHKQLRPKILTHSLTKVSEQGFDLDISLFERLILKNKIHSSTLEVQHRMRPQISKIIQMNTYPNLKDHDSVHLYPNIKGITNNLVFIDHRVPETYKQKLDKDSSFSNQHEAQMCVEMVRYFILQGYKSDQLVILTPYIGQQRAINNIMPYNLKVRISTIDNYQGEESDIVIISLVRSNNKGQIGFLKEPQRVNVMLSRARYAMILIGNLSTLTLSIKGRDVWKPIIDYLISQNNVMQGLPTICQYHPNEILIIKNAIEFQNRLQKGCLQKCLQKMKCGHLCMNQCHSIDREHKSVECQQNCEKFCLFNHPCKKKCFEECQLCSEQVMVKLPLCGHNKQINCHQQQNLEKISCLVDVFVQLPCKHSQFVKCCQSHDLNKIICKIDVNVQLPCKHSQMVQCCQSHDLNKIICKIDVNVQLPCKHSQIVQCDKSHDLNKIDCKKQVDKLLKCGHYMQMECDQRLQDDIKCQTKCDQELPCLHIQQISCYQKLNMINIQCQEIIEVKLKCGHLMDSECFNRYNLNQKCEFRMEKLLDCGHYIDIYCHQKNQNKFICNQEVQVQLPCNHSKTIKCHMNNSTDLNRIICDGINKQKCGQCGHVKSIKCLEKDQFKCEQEITLELECGHKKKLKCQDRNNQIKCEQEITIELECGHKKTLQCVKRYDNQNCLENTEIKLPACKHPQMIICKDKGNPKMCKFKIEKSLNCGHKKIVECEQNLNEIQCQEIIKHTLKCGHDQSINCFLKNSYIECNQLTPIKLSCNHDYMIKCKDNNPTNICNVKCENFIDVQLKCKHWTKCKCMEIDQIMDKICEQETEIVLDCTHTQKTKCGNKGIQCTNKINFQLECDHLITIKCSEQKDYHECQVKVKKQLLCGHSEKVECGRDISKIDCQKIVDAQLICGHTIKIECYKKSRDSMLNDQKCQSQVQVKLACGHLNVTQCYLSNDISKLICKQFKSIQLNCGHKIDTSCSETNIQNLNCTFKKQKKLQCGHICEVFCSNKLPQNCIKECGFEFACNDHKCKNICGTNCKNHKKCDQKCGQSLFCGHNCQNDCHIDFINTIDNSQSQSNKNCIQCLSKCRLKCSHTTCRKQCQQECDICTNSCSWKCPHQECKLPCFAPCERKPCDIRCNKKLSCGHQCPGICGEECLPIKFCQICSSPQIKNSNTKIIGFQNYQTLNLSIDPIILLQCEHFFQMSEMDEFMQLNQAYHDQSIPIQLAKTKCCPLCDENIQDIQRYNRIFKFQFLKIQEIKSAVKVNKEIKSIQSSINIYNKKLQPKIRKLQELSQNIQDSPLFKVHKQFPHLIQPNQSNLILVLKLLTKECIDKMDEQNQFPKQAQTYYKIAKESIKQSLQISKDQKFTVDYHDFLYLNHQFIQNVYKNQKFTDVVDVNLSQSDYQSAIEYCKQNKYHPIPSNNVSFNSALFKCINNHETFQPEQTNYECIHCSKN